MMKGVDEGLLQWFNLVERMENDYRIVKEVYAGEWAGSH